jgi:hypothetical protein
VNKNFYFSIYRKSIVLVKTTNDYSLKRYRGVEYLDELNQNDFNIIDDWIKNHESPLLLTIYGVEVDD